jgi:hypothetical protein
LTSLEAQRKRDLEDWMDDLKLDCFVFPANGDVGLADLELNLESATHSLQNGVKYSNGNRAIRHLGVPTVSVPMGLLEDKKMPVNLTFAGKAYDDVKLLGYARAFEQRSKRRTSPPLAPPLETDRAGQWSERSAAFPKGNLGLTASCDVTIEGDATRIRISGLINSGDAANVEVYLNGKKAGNASVGSGSWEMVLDHEGCAPRRLGWDLKPLPPRPVMVLVVARSETAPTAARLLWASG